jgi:hypothetical protein
MASDAIVDSSKVGFDDTEFKNVMFDIKNHPQHCPKFNVYLVSKTCLLIFIRISLKSYL